MAGSSAPPWAGLRELARRRVSASLLPPILSARAPEPPDLESSVRTLDRDDARVAAAAHCSSELFSAAVPPCTRPRTSSARHTPQTLELDPPRSRTRGALLIGANQRRRRPPHLRSSRRAAITAAVIARVHSRPRRARHHVRLVARSMPVRLVAPVSSSPANWRRRSVSRRLGLAMGSWAEGLSLAAAHGLLGRPMR